MHIDLFVLFCQITNFLVLVYLLKRFLFGRIIKAMDDREAKIAARFEEAHAMKVKASEDAELFEKKKRSLEERKEQLLNEATTAADAKRKELMAKVREEIDQLKTRWQDMLIREQQAFYSDLRQRAAKQLYATARKALRDLADAELEERIVNKFLRRISTIDEEKRIQIQKAIGSGDKPIVVQSAFGISERERKVIEDTLRQQIANNVEINYIQQQEIVSGIELRVDGHKIAWSLNEYLESLVEDVTETLQKEAHAA
jgi:F-type H+-transporting ATPase subunit b